MLLAHVSFLSNSWKKTALSKGYCTLEYFLKTSCKLLQKSLSEEFELEHKSNIKIRTNLQICNAEEGRVREK